mmetsp:Transcript_7126/g.10366  ORF Transcript_7126/g.10366 Transcript_7126/m.10366 type:complete len:279 (-) Transcript_7126:337-1173(-)
MGRVAIKNGRVAVRNLTGVVHNNNLSFKHGDRRCGMVLRVGGDETTTKILHSHVLYVEPNIVSRNCLRQRFVVHFYRFDFRHNACGREHGMNTGFDDTSFNTSYGDSSNTTNLVHVLKRQAKGLIGGTLGRRNIVQSLKKVRSLIPGHVGRLLNHVVTLPSRDGYKRNLHGLVANLLQVVGHFLLNFVVTSLLILDSLIVHLVACYNHLLHTKSVGQQGMFTSLSVLGDTSFESTLRRVNDKNGNIGLRRTSDHVLDEITVARCVNDGEGVLGRFELP